MNNVKRIIHYLRETYFNRISHDLMLAINPPQATLVSFLGCGAQKSGTTALDSYLRQHPGICLPSRKEIHYFDNDYNFRYPKPNYKKYHSFFDFQAKHIIAGEVTPSYMYRHNAIRRIWEYNPNMKVVILLRNPIERAYSHWNMNRSRGFEDQPFLEAIRLEEERRYKALPNQNKRFSYIDRGFYTEQIRNVYEYFPRDQVFLQKSSVFSEDPAAVIGEIFQFLSITPSPIQIKNNIFSGSYARPMSSEEKDLLLDIYEFEIKSLERLTGWDCSEWLN